MYYLCWDDIEHKSRKVGRHPLVNSLKSSSRSLCLHHLGPSGYVPRLLERNEFVCGLVAKDLGKVQMVPNHTWSHRPPQSAPVTPPTALITFPVRVTTSDLWIWSELDVVMDTKQVPNHHSTCQNLPFQITSKPPPVHRATVRACFHNDFRTHKIHSW